MSKELNGDFRVLVEREMAALGFVVVRWEGTQVKYRAAGGDGKVLELGTGNVRKRVRLSDPADAPGIVREFITNVTAVTSETWKMPETLEECADQLLPRIGQPFAKGGPSPWSQPLPGAGELVANIVIDFPTTMAYVTPDMMAKSATSPEVWFDRALANLRAITKPDWLTPMKGDAGILCCHTTDSYDAARALLLCELTGNDPHGWLVAVPARDWLFARKVEMSGLPHFHFVKIMAEKAKKEQPYPISDTVFWLRPGQPWLEFPIEVTGKDVRLTPPDDFIQTLNALSTEGDVSG